MLRLTPTLFALVLLACSSSTRTVPGGSDDKDDKSEDAGPADDATAEPTEPKPRGPQPPTGHAMSADLDGDGKEDRIVVTNEEVWIEGQRAFHDPIESLGSWEYKIVDFDVSDGRKELVLLDPGADGIASIFVYAFFDKAIHTTKRLVVGDWNDKLPGNGIFRVLGGTCGQSTTWVYRLHQGKLVEVSKQTTGVRDEDLCP